MAQTPLRKWVAEKVFDRLVGVFASWFTAAAETQIRQAHIEFLSDVEDQARRLEAEGKQALAGQLRENAAGQLENAGHLAIGFINNLAESDGAGPPRLNNISDVSKDSSEDPKPSRTRRARRRQTTRGANAESDS